MSPRGLVCGDIRLLLQRSFAHILLGIEEHGLILVILVCLSRLQYLWLLNRDPSLIFGLPLVAYLPILVVRLFERGCASLAELAVFGVFFVRVILSDRPRYGSGGVKILPPVSSDERLVILVLVYPLGSCDTFIKLVFENLNGLVSQLCFIVFASEFLIV